MLCRRKGRALSDEETASAAPCLAAMSSPSERAPGVPRLAGKNKIWCSQSICTVSRLGLYGAGGKPVGDDDRGIIGPGERACRSLARGGGQDPVLRKVARWRGTSHEHRAPGGKSARRAALSRFAKPHRGRACARSNSSKRCVGSPSPTRRAQCGRRHAAQIIQKSPGGRIIAPKRAAGGASGKARPDSRLHVMIPKALSRLELRCGSKPAPCAHKAHRGKR